MTGVPRRNFAVESTRSFAPPPPPPPDMWRRRLGITISVTFISGLIFVLTLPKDWDWNTGKSVGDGEDTSIDLASIVPVPVEKAK
jgi:hypothetical protein